MKLVISGFDPFGGMVCNSSQTLVEGLALLSQSRAATGWAATLDLHTLVLPTVYGRSVEKLQAAVARQTPELVVMLGVAPSIRELRLETQAINQISTSLPDNDGYRAPVPWIDHKGPATLASDLDLPALQAQLKDLGVDVGLSSNCGDYVCNHLYYEMLRFSQRRSPACRALFVHVPDLHGTGDELSAAREMPQRLNDLAMLIQCLTSAAPV